MSEQVKLWKMYMAFKNFDAKHSLPSYQITTQIWVYELMAAYIDSLMVIFWFHAS